MCSALSTFNTMTEAPLGKGPIPQLLPGRCSINGCPLLCVCVHFGWDKCRALIPTMGHHTWPYVTLNLNILWFAACTVIRREGAPDNRVWLQTCTCTLRHLRFREWRHLQSFLFCSFFFFFISQSFTTVAFNSSSSFTMRNFAHCVHILLFCSHGFSGLVFFSYI